MAVFALLPVALTVLMSVSFPQLSSAAIIYQEWNISYTDLAPDCVTQGRPTINGQMPGPPVYAVNGDRIKIKVCNNMYYNVSIHWHGMNMQQQNWFDGSTYGVQCPIQYNECFLYDFIANNVTGTFWYHGHIELLRASVYGAFIIYPNSEEPKAPYKADGEHVVIMSDWYHRTNSDILKGLESTNWQFIGEPDSLLVNGRGMVYCNNYQCPAPPNPCGKCDRSNPKCNPLSHFDVQPGKTYLFRLLNVGLWGQLNFEIKGHKLTLVRADGYYTKSYTTTSIDINPGMAFDVLVTMDQKPNNYWIGVNGEYDNVGINPPGLAVIKYLGSPVYKQTQPYDAFPTGPSVYDTTFGRKQQALFRNYNNVQKEASRKVDAYYSMRINQNMVGPYVRYSINNHSFVRPETPLLVSEYFKIDTAVFSTFNELPHSFPPVNKNARGLQPAKPAVSVLSIKTGDFVQIVINNNNPPGGNHPFHLHGNPFYVMGYFPGVYDEAKEAKYAKKYNYVDPPQRNMVTVFQDHFVVIRFLANNPGIWNMHCHMEPHMHLGMQLFVRVSSDQFGSDIEKPPADYPTCGALSPQLLQKTRGH